MTADKAQETDALIVGGGVSGLTVAWGLERRGIRAVVIEAGPRAGGTIGSVRREDCLIETGPNSTLETSPLVGELIEQTHIAGSRIYANAAAKTRYILRGGRLIPVPLSLPAFLATPLFSWRSKLALLREPFVRSGSPDADETVAQFVLRRLGGEFLDYAIDPFVAGVYAGDPRLLSLRAAFPRLFELEQRYGSLIRGQIIGAKDRRRDPEKSRQAAPMLSFRDGMQTLTDAIARTLSSVVTSTRTHALTRGASGSWEVRAEGPGGATRVRARSIVLAVPAYVAAGLVKDHAPSAAAALEAIPYPPVAAVVTAYDRRAVRHPLDGFGFLVPREERRRILGTIFSSTLFENRAPPDTALTTTFVGGMRQPELGGLDEAAIAALVQEELAALLGAPVTARWARVIRWSRAIPQYTVGHLGRIAEVEAAERASPGLFFCANYRGGISVADCIKSGYATADRVAAHLQP